LCDAVKGCQKAPACSVNTDCHAGACQTSPRCDGGACHFDGCAAGTKCCSGASTASGCKICCDDSECNDNNPCTKDACGANGCSHTPDNSQCAQGQICDLRYGCVACQKDAQCDDGLACTTDTCIVQTDLHPASCSNVSTCGKLQYCTSNGCSTCVSDSDCQGGVTTQNVILPVGCSTSTCVKGQCQTTVQDCGDFQTCCPPYGCQLKCGIQTQ